MATHKVKFKRVVEYEADGKRWRKVTGAEAKQYAKADAVRDTYESSPGVPSYAYFVSVDAKLIEVSKEE